ncbi:MAG: DUF1304 domain-containing protein [Kordiimonadaceae bacterium]|nr:DUF1304 domain-containing protein [Kordiimonadaceae bacterium]
MKLLATIATGFVALSHFGFMALEMFFWNHPTGQKIFNITPEFAAASEALAANQGLYNGFLAAGLVWGMLSKKTDVVKFFLMCVIVAGFFGGYTVSLSIIKSQALPALIALALVIWTNRKQRAAT